MSATLPHLIFDLDGTLVDSAPMIQAVANRVADEFVLEPLSVAETISFIGRGADVFVRRMLHSRGRTSEADYADAVARFRTAYADAPTQLSIPMVGAEDALDRLAATGHRLAICTNRPTEPTNLELKSRGWSDRFEAVVCGDTLKVRKPDPAPLHHAIARLGGGDAIFIGDSETDAETAKAAGLPFVVYAHGYRKGRLEDMPHTMQFGDFAILPDIISRVRTS
ncbi:MAG: phosphoglycolate phosphatase [Pseudomonadota bacterium]